MKQITQSSDIVWESSSIFAFSNISKLSLKNLEKYEVSYFLTGFYRMFAFFTKLTMLSKCRMWIFFQIHAVCLSIDFAFYLYI